MIIQNKYLLLLKEFISFKSISTDPKFQPEIAKTVDWLKSKFKENGFKVEIIKGYGNPLILASLTVNPKLETILIYGHYDVQPAAKEDGWKNEPFAVNEDKERYYGRGAIDNKGQVLVHIATVFDLVEKRGIKYNIKFIIEGDEETGSENIEKFIKNYRKKLKADFILISDGELTGEHACLDSSFRGIVNFTLKIKTSDKDNHSGLYGGAIPNAANELIKILSKMHDNNGNLTIEGINKIKKFNQKVLENNKGIPYVSSEFRKVTGVKKRFNEKNIDFYTQTACLTSAEITTLNSGYLGEGYKNAIPGSAFAKINFRIAPPTTVKEVKKIFNNFIKENVPDYVSYNLYPDQSSEGFVIDTKNKITMKAKEILTKAYGKKVYDRPCGAIIPIGWFFIKYLKSPVISIGLANEDCNMHAANENFKKTALDKALKFSKSFLGGVK